ICDLAAGKCVACDPSHACPGTSHCGPAGHCVECLQSTDCPASNACVFNHCLPQCTTNGSCPTGTPFCEAGPCAACRSTADCTNRPFTACNAGTCVPTGACLLDGDCPPSQLCVIAGGGGLCADRPTQMTLGKYACTTPCDCRTGELCSGGWCVADVVPT